MEASVAVRQRVSSVPALVPHAALAAAVVLELAFEARLTQTDSAYWLLLAAAVATAALVYAWRRQEELRFAPVLALAVAYQLGVVLIHIALAATGDQDPVAFATYGNELLDGRYPQAEYPAGAILLFGVEALVGDGSVLTPNRLLMVPFQALCVAGIWGLHTKHSRWLAATLAVWPMSVFYWEYRFDLVPAGFVVLGLLLAYRGRWGWSGVAMGLGTIVKWSPALSFLVLVAWLVAGRRRGDLERLAGGFAVVLIVHVPLLLWDANNVLNPYTDQGSRAITNESLWYFPLAALGLTGGDDRVWAPAGAPGAADVLVALVQAALVAGLVVATVVLRQSASSALTLAALAPAAFLLTNRVFSPQFMLVVAAMLLFAAALTVRSRREQLLVALLVMGAAFANAFVYPYSDRLLDLSWRPASALAYTLSLAALVVVLRRALEGRPVAVATELVDEAPDFGFRDAIRSLDSGPREAEGSPELPKWTRRVLYLVVGTLGALFSAAAIFAALVLPYRYWDSLAMGSWSRSIAEGHGLWDNASVFALSRPVFYVPQGLLWRWIDDGEWVGRLYSSLFAVLLAASVWIVAGRLSSRSSAAPVARTLAVGLLLGSAVFAGLVAAGMTDVPVAAGCAATAAVLWGAPTRWLVLAAVVLTAMTVLAKSTGLVALAGLVGGLFVLNGRRALPGAAGVALGAALALAYDAWQASRIDWVLMDFLRAGNEQYWLDRGAAARWDALARAEWLGPSIRLLVLFGVVHGTARAVGARPRIAMAAGAASALTWSLVGPIVADGGAPHPFDGAVVGLAAWVVLAAALVLAPFVAADDPVDRRTHVALIVWLTPMFVLWSWTRADEVRHLAPAWAPLVLVTAAALVSVSFALARLRPWAVIVPALVVAVLAVANLPKVDGLGRQGWDGLLDLGWSGWTSRGAVENYAWGPFSYVVQLARENMGADDRAVTSDGRLAYFFPGRVETRYARTCRELESARFFSFLTAGESLVLAQREGQPTDPLGWLQCAEPRVELVGEQPGVYAAFVVGAPPARPPTAGDCHLSSTPGTALDAVFGANLSYMEAKALLERALAVGFVGTRIERTGCSTFRVVVTGIPEDEDVQAKFAQQVEGVGLNVEYAPAERFSEVSPDIPPVSP